MNTPTMKRRSLVDSTLLVLAPINQPSPHSSNCSITRISSPPKHRPDLSRGTFIRSIRGSMVIFLSGLLCLMTMTWSYGIFIVFQQRRRLFIQPWEGPLRLRVEYRRKTPSTEILPAMNKISATWRNRYGVVHVIQTRFMQFQPHLVELGWARLRLFEAITMPSVMQQTQSEFLWILRADPALDADIREDLLRILAPYDNVIVAGSNDNPEGFRNAGCIADLTDLWMGSVETLQSFWEASQTHPILETRLDADDALLVDFCDLVQRDAIHRLSATSSDGTLSNINFTPHEWVVWCVDNHLEWHYESPWANDSSEYGAILGLKARHCVTAGLTWGYSIRNNLPDGPDKEDLANHKHQDIHQTVPACDDAFFVADGITSTASDYDEDVRDDRDSTSRWEKFGCMVRVKPPDNLPAAIRARTPTSAGMEHIVGIGLPWWKRSLEHSNWRSQQEELFQILTVLFGIEASHLRRTKAYIQDHLPAIVEDALVGQCTKGHSCKDEAQENLKAMALRG